MTLLADIYRARSWQIRRYGKGGYWECPINAVGGGCAADADKYALIIGLSHNDAYHVMMCADSKRGKLRSRVLAACGVKEVNKYKISKRIISRIIHGYQ